MWRGLPILRDPDSKWYASYDQMPRQGEEGEGEFYPTDCSGSLWITSPGTSQAISEAAQDVRFFWIDDVWVTGFIAEHLNIQHQVRKKSDADGLRIEGLILFISNSQVQKFFKALSN